MSILFIVGPKYTMAVSLAAPEVTPGEYADETDRRTDERTPDRYITLSARCGQRNNIGYYAMKHHIIHD